MSNDEVELIKVYRDGHETRERMWRYIAELEIGTIPLEQPNVASARIVPYAPVLKPSASYPVKNNVNWSAAMAVGQALWGFSSGSLVA